MRDFNPQLWFANREMDHVPTHFIKCPTPITYDRLEWVKTNLTGRYAILSVNVWMTSLTIIEETKTIHFEDPKEATFYELRWAGTKNN